MDKKFVWITGGDQNYLLMIEVLAKSLLKYSKYKLIVYGFNCDSNINLPNVINKRINYFPKHLKELNSKEPDLINKDYSVYFAKYLANLDSLNENFNKFAWIDGDAFVTEHIDKSLKYLNKLEDYPLFMKYFHNNILNWKIHNNIRLEGEYGSELTGVYNHIPRNPNNKIIATGFYFYDANSKDFFNKCLSWNHYLNSYNIKIYVDDNAFSEERVANCILWEENKTLDLPITWNNYYSSKDETLVNSYFLKQGFDVMYDKNTLEPYFVHGPDPSILTKSSTVLNRAFNDYTSTKLMIVAHPDDEIIFGSTELIKYGSEYKVLCLTNKSNKIRSKEFEKVMKELNINSWEILDYEDTLMPTQNFDLKGIINCKDWKKIVTHNPIGEYGHPQHKLAFDAVKNETHNFYIFNKSSKKINQNYLNTKNHLLKLYKSEQEMFDQIKTKNGDWFKSNSDTNYIEYESIIKYDANKDITPYIACYDK